MTPLRTQAYDPYGFSPLGLEQGALGFNGWSKQSIAGLYLLGNGYRAYNPALRRFLSPDSWSPFGRGDINSYVYCKCDPVNFQDDSGHMPGRERGNVINLSCSPAQGKPPEAASRHGRRAMTRPLPLNQAV
ncbi:RHS repeat-associated core domain-containing protein [Pseudomonas putida]